jgi:hypothetical protein
MTTLTMSSTIPSHQMAQVAAPYIPSRDSMDRHDYGITKNRKASSTGGGRAWSDEEVSQHYTAQLLNTSLTLNAGVISHSDSTPEDAIQVHCCPPQED